MQHDNDIHLKVHEPAFSIHIYRSTSDHQAVPECEKAVSQSACRDVVIWLLPMQLLPLTYVRFSIRPYASALFRHLESTAIFSRSKQTAAHTALT